MKKKREKKFMTKNEMDMKNQPNKIGFLHIYILLHHLIESN